MATFLPAVCERSRAFVSLGLDGELAELEQRMLDAHLARCPSCRADAWEFGAITGAVRATPLERVDGPTTPRLRRSRAARLRPVAAVAATLLLGLGAGGAVRTAGEPAVERASQPRTWPVPTRYLSDDALLAEQQHIARSRPGSTSLLIRF